MADLLSSLNSDQIKAVTHESGPALVLAGAGSGKTTVLTRHAAWLVQERGVPSDAVLLVTFTNKAAQEIMTRIQQQTGQPLGHSGTFHSICARILRKHAPYVKLSRDFVIYDSDDQLQLLKQVYKRHGFSPDLKPSVARALISTAKNELKPPEELLDTATSERDVELAKVYRAYQQALFQANAVDFDDLLLHALTLFEESAYVREQYQRLFQYVLVDEYQDTNKAQYLLTQHWAAPQNNVFVVGDFCQSIYSWRGADFRNMMQFKEDFPDHTEYRLEQNYRSNQSILDAASSVIRQNQSHPTLTLWTERADNHPITVLEHNSSDDEAKSIAQAIKNSSIPLSQVAILYRTNVQSRPFEDQFISHGIPYRLIGGVKFYERKEIKDVLAYAKLVVNPADSVSMQRAQKLGKRRLSAFMKWRETQPALSTVNAAVGLQSIVEATGYLETLDERIPEDQERIDNILELYALAQPEPTITSLLERVALLQDADQFQEAQPANGVILMSLHSAKGLEFDHVYMVGMEEGLLPHARSLYDPFQLEEERRLCYVGITRAKQFLTLSFAHARFQYGRASISIPSRFLAEIPQEIVQPPVVHQYDSPNHASAASSQRRLIQDDELDAVLRGERTIRSFLDS